MLQSQALVLTDRPWRYAAELARELRRDAETEWSAESGSVTFGDGSVDMHSWPEGLRLDAFARTKEGLAHVEGVIKQHLERTGEGLQVEWTLRPLSV